MLDRAHWTELDKYADRPNSILLIEDEERVANGIMFQLQRMEYAVALRRDGRSGLEAALLQVYDLIVLDLILPEMDGLSLCRKLREAKVATPIIIISARGSELDRIVGLEMGADDYLDKPFDVAELEARIRAVWRRSQVMSKQILCYGPLHLDCETHEMFMNRKRARLTKREYELLSLLIRHPGRVFSREGLLERIWGSNNQNYLRNVDAHVGRLRRKLQQIGGDSDWLESMYAVGFRLRRL